MGGEGEELGEFRWKLDSETLSDGIGEDPELATAS